MSSDAGPVPARDLTEFVTVRPRLFGIAYRMLGSVTEAEDVVQDTWIRWQRADRGSVRNPAAFLTTTTTRLAVNAATSARATRETYVGPWLPEPVDTSADPTLGAERAEAVDVAVLLLLEKLTPTERAAYVLREALNYSHRQVAEVLDTTEANARQLVSRARRHLAAQRSAPAPAAERRRLAEAFLAAARDGDLAGLERLLTQDVLARSDGGGRVRAARLDIRGLARVSTFLDNVLRKYWHSSTFRLVDTNGAASVLVLGADGSPQTLVTLDASARGVERLLLVANPDKLRGFAT
ncbi:RNA polymerase sigma factor SigJ [Micromonospora endolithica]|uniref:Sigma-70 family RNA polymerase sigma factor n=1 Tax=Micromonospora endolithica TaxID=230091 RepID=A0A3A9ZSR6_9ACTN|nr:RNA polymerase sigma factor SigJ [Micromonospora endolithica]RKN51173.1 sigma-70 family RNA polymerase sigma factor [Micromonospora endolithica]TWJ22380.1 RNA polymerase sigma-70 factor (ECF subfamily) [Micromonospora endolithica]